MKKWCFVAASMAGTSHTSAGTLCQDRSLCSVLETSGAGDVLVAAVADGAGSAARGGDGAECSSRTFLDEIERFYALDPHPSSITRDTMSQWLRVLRNKLEVMAAEEELRLQDFAATLIVVVAETDYVAFFQIGDGAIVVSPYGDREQYSLVFHPQQGEYANSTRFVTDSDAETSFEFNARCGRDIEELALFSDGIQRMVLEYPECVPFSPFFQAAFGPLRAEASGRSLTLSRALEAFLASPRVCERTDDDTSLVLATRRPIEALWAGSDPS